MTDKPKFGMYWTSGCGGCEVAVLNIHEKLLEVDENFEIVFWPIAMDGKVKDVEALPDGSITLMLINGGIRTSENEEMAKLLTTKIQNSGRIWFMRNRRMYSQVWRISPARMISSKLPMIHLPRIILMVYGLNPSL